MTENVTQAESTLVRDRAVRLFTYLKELTELRGDVRRNCDEYDQVIWLAEIPKEKECYCAAWDLGRDPAYEDWLRVERPRRKRPPAPPAVLVPWLSEREISDASLDAPQLKDSIVEELGSTEGSGGVETVVRRLEESPTVKRQWELYVENHWWPWALEERRLQPIQSIYNELFAAYQNQERMGEAYEVVVGFGLLIWRPPHGPEINRHVAVAQATIELDSKTGVITVGLPADGARLTLEQDMLEPQDRPLPEIQNRIQQELSDIGDAVWAGPGLATALNGYFQQLWSEGTLDMALQPHDGAADRTRPRMNLAPALLVRKRSDRNLVRIFAEITDQLSDGGVVPVGVDRLVRIRDDHQFMNDSETESDEVEEEELYFPLPANEAQRQIAQRLARRQGVLVQGPPGTGKSHTIANLICHLLATGKRLLITSHTARALRVLKKYFPPEFSPLCVSLLGDDTAALRELEDSVQGILSQLNQWDSEKKQARIQQLMAELDGSRRQLAEGYSKLKAIRAKETESVNLHFGGYCATPQGLAVRLASEASRLSWIGADVDPDEEPPITDDEAILLLKLWRELGEDTAGEFGRVLPELAAIPNPGSFEQRVLKERELSNRMQAVGSESTALVNIFASAPIETRKALESALREYLAFLDNLSSDSEDWVKTAIQEITRGRHHSWEKLAAATRVKLEVLKDHIDRAAQLKVAGIEKRNRVEVRAHAETLRDHLLAGKGVGRSLRYNPFASKQVKSTLYLVDEVRVNGRPCERQEETAALLEYLDVIEGIEYVDEQWSPYLSPSSLPILLRFSDQLRRAELLEKVLDLRNKAKAVAILMADIPAAGSPGLDNRQAGANLLNLLAVANIQDELRKVQAEILHAIAELRYLRHDPNAHSLGLELLAGAEGRDLERYSKAYAAIISAWEFRSKQQQCRVLEAQLKRLDLVAKIQPSRDDTIWDERFANLAAAWNWSRASARLMRHADPHQESSVRQEIELLQQRIRHGLRELGAWKAWEFVLSRLRPEQREHLMAWRRPSRKSGRERGNTRCSTVGRLVTISIIAGRRSPHG